MADHEQRPEVGNAHRACLELADLDNVRFPDGYRVELIERG